MQPNIWDLLAKKLSGEASSQELDHLQELLKSNPDLHYPMQAVADLWHQPVPQQEDSQLAFTNHTARLRQLGVDLEGLPPAGPKRHQPLPRRYLLIATAVLSLGFLLYSLFAFPVAKEKPATAKLDKSEVSTRYGSRTKLVLPDGTQVWLNSGSKITYDKSYGNGTREITLSGEAYFDVLKNASLPFIIHTANLNIKVTGTAFNVKAFPTDKKTETSLIRGSIEVSFKNRPDQKIILHPSEKLISSNEDPAAAAGPAIVQPARRSNPVPEHPGIPVALVSHLTYTPADSTVVETSWMENKLIFRSETFEELGRQMERWYGYNISFTDEAIRKKRLTGTFEHENIRQALKALQLIAPFTYTINNNDISISTK